MLAQTAWGYLVLIHTQSTRGKPKRFTERCDQAAIPILLKCAYFHFVILNVRTILTKCYCYAREGAESGLGG